MKLRKHVDKVFISQYKMQLADNYIHSFTSLVLYCNSYFAILIIATVILFIAL